MKAIDGLNLAGRLSIVLVDKDGNIKEQREETNLVVNAGLNFICDRMEGTTEAVMSHMGLGSDNTAPAAGDTDLGSLLGSRETIDSTVVTANTIQYSCTFEAGDGTGAVTEAGIFNAASAGTMLCRTTFSVVNKDVDDTMTITWTITLTAS
jgi:hypothetical protein